MSEDTQLAIPQEPLAVSVLTGFLGSGKTTLLRHLLAHPAMEETAVIVNEFGEIGLDHLLVEQVSEDTVLLNSGCLCCTVRGDLIASMRDLFRRRVKREVPPFQRLVIETTGLADPAPILQTIMSDPLLSERFRLDGVITTVDAASGAATLDRHIESVKQAKADLGSPEILWYRGHPNSEFYLLASLLRFKNGLDKERHLFTSFKKFSDRILKRRDSEWETLFEMQHYGIPTRLLDWSETFGIALFFAATYNQSHHPDKDAAVYLLDPVALNKISGIDRIFRVPRDEDKFGYAKIY